MRGRRLQNEINKKESIDAQRFVDMAEGPFCAAVPHDSCGRKYVGAKQRICLRYLSRLIRFESEQGAEGSGVLASLEDSVELSLLDTAALMISLSDDTAPTVCIDQVGMDRVNQLSRDLGLSQTLLQRNMMASASAGRIEFGSVLIQ